MFGLRQFDHWHDVVICPEFKFQNSGIPHSGNLCAPMSDAFSGTFLSSCLFGQADGWVQNVRPYWSYRASQKLRIIFDRCCRHIKRPWLSRPHCFTTAPIQRHLALRFFIVSFVRSFINLFGMTGLLFSGSGAVKGKTQIPIASPAAGFGSRYSNQDLRKCERDIQKPSHTKPHGAVLPKILPRSFGVATPFRHALQRTE